MNLNLVNAYGNNGSFKKKNTMKISSHKFKIFLIPFPHMFEFKLCK